MRILIVFMFIFFFSCGKDDSRIVFSHSERKLIDSLATKQKKIIGSEIDSLCTLHFDDRVQALVDSIMEKRLEEQKRLLSF